MIITQIIYLIKQMCDINIFMKEIFEYVDKDTINKAAKAGQVEIVKWLHKNDFPLNGYIYIIAAENGHLKVLK